MFDRYVFIEGSAHNVSENGHVVAFQLDTLITYYRGIPLSMLHELELVVDGVTAPFGDLLISPNGGDDWFTLDEATTVIDPRYKWEYGRPLSVRWQVDGGLTPGEHDVTLRVKVRTSYIPVPFGGEMTRRVTV
jgi:hypothetical protein